MKTLGELYEETPDERFNIELEKNVSLGTGTFVKSKTEKAKIDIWFSLENIENDEKHSCAIAWRTVEAGLSFLFVPVEPCK